MRPNKTAEEIASACRVSKRHVYEAESEGIIRISGQKDKARLYAINKANEAGPGRDKVVLAVTILVNEAGEFSVKSKLRNQSKTAKKGNPRPVFKKDYTITIPREAEENDIVREVFQKSHLILEGVPYTVVGVATANDNGTTDDNLRNSGAA